jgi:ATP-binding cassette subfamily F protein 3
LDLWAREALERSLKAFGGTLLFVSHDRYFLNRVADHLLVIGPDRSHAIEGNYETYLYLAKQRRAVVHEQSPQPHQTPSAATAKKRPQSPKTPGRRKRKFSYRKVEDIEAEIAERETRIEELHAALASPEVARDGKRIKQAAAELEQHQQALLTLYEHWEEATELNG